MPHKTYPAYNIPLPEAYETYYQLAEADPNATILAEDSKDGNAYFFYTVIVH